MMVYVPVMMGIVPQTIVQTGRWIDGLRVKFKNMFLPRNKTWASRNDRDPRWHLHEDVASI